MHRGYLSPFWAISLHMPLLLTFKAAALCTKFGFFFIGKLFLLGHAPSTRVAGVLAFPKPPAPVCVGTPFSFRASLALSLRLILVPGSARRLALRFWRQFLPSPVGHRSRHLIAQTVVHQLPHFEIGILGFESKFDPLLPQPIVCAFHKLSSDVVVRQIM